jgi:hypothetical protein
MVRLVSFRVRECRQAGSNKWIRERDTKTDRHTDKKSKETTRNIDSSVIQYLRVVQIPSLEEAVIAQQ